MTISSTASSWTAFMRRCRVAVAEMPARLDPGSPEPPHRLLEPALDPGLVRWRDESDLGRRLLRPLAKRGRSGSPTIVWFATTSTCALAGLVEVDHDVVDGNSRCYVARSTRLPRSQPERTSGWVEMMTSSGWYCLQPVLERLERVRVDDGPAGGDSLRGGGRAYGAGGAPRSNGGSLVDDEAGARLVLRADAPSRGWGRRRRACGGRRGASARRRSRSRARGCAAARPRSGSDLLGLCRLRHGRPVAVEDRVARAANAVLVRAAHHLRDLVEVEDGRRRGDLPLERERPPRIGGRRLAAAPADDQVVEEDEGRGAEEERAIVITRFQSANSGA